MKITLLDQLLRRKIIMVSNYYVSNYYVVNRDCNPPAPRKTHQFEGDSYFGQPLNGYRAK